VNLFEALKKTFVKDDISYKKLSAEVQTIHKTKELTDDPFGGAMVLSHLDQVDYSFGQGMDVQSYQNSLIEKYRELATDTEVSNGVDIIVNEMIYTMEQKIFKIDINEENEKIKDLISDTFNEVLSLLNVTQNIFNICRQMYIDGQLNVALIYQKGSVQDGIKKAYILEPQNLYYDKQDKHWKYAQNFDVEFLYQMDEQKQETFSESELVHVDYGLYTKYIDEMKLAYQVNLSYLEGVFKNANMLQTLENMLVPLRYSRSVSRRMFNIDVADLPPKQAKELMDKIRTEFRYKKTYDPSTGTIRNLKSTQPLVEDYWLSNRSGGRGTTIDMMDEKGSLMDLEDIRHAAKKLYTSMKIPSNRNPYSEDQPTFSFDATEIEQEEMMFYVFVSRLRIPVITLIKEIMRRQLVAKKQMSDTEWKQFEKKIEIKFTNESIFLENMKKELFMKNAETFTGYLDQIGKVMSLETATQYSFGWSTEQLQNELKKITEEASNPLYKGFYDRDEAEDADPWA
jgi:hypothetical protein